MIQVKSGMIFLKSGMIQVKSGMFLIKSGMFLVKSGMIKFKSGSAVGFGLSRWLGRSRTSSVRLVFRTWTWSKLHFGCKWIETVHSPIGLSDLIGRMNLNWDVWSVLISLVHGLGHIIPSFFKRICPQIWIVYKKRRKIRHIKTRRNIILTL
ncbi:hypothetical protein YC2023_039610 [Brassica napus]